MAGHTPHFETFGIAVYAGRTFTEAEIATNAPVAVLTERAARIGWPDGDAVGHYVSGPNEPPRQIVGVVGNVRASKQIAGPAIVYIPLHPTLLPRGVSDIAVKLRGDREALRSQLLAVTKGADGQSRPTIRSYDDIFESQIAVPRFQKVLFTSFGAVGLVVASCGILGVVQYVVSRRTREIGIRMALGAQAPQVRRMVLRQALAPVAAGLFVGFVVSAWVSRALEPWLFEIRADDPTTLAAAALLLIGTAAVAAYLPAQHAARISPIDAIRAE